ncbi:MAG: HEAT repeat domain-containing protein [Candidatus Helarchaeota archaeon]
MSSQNDIEKLVKKLKHKKAEVRIEAIEDLIELNNPEAVEPIIECLKDPDSDVKYQAIIALGEFKSSKGVGQLLAKF